MALVRLRAGSQAYIRAIVRDNRVSPPVLFAPATGVRLTLTNPLGTAIVDDDVMTGSGGTYAYLYQSSAADELGVWSASVRTIDGSAVVLTEPEAAFILVA